MEQISISAASFFAGLLCVFYGSMFQGKLLGKGSIDMGKDGAYMTLTGETAQTNINFFWVGAVFLFSTAIIQLIIAVRREFKTSQAFDYSTIFMICPNCEKPFSMNTEEKGTCPDCHIELVKLHGFYDK